MDETEEEHLASMEYIIESIVNGQRAQAISLFHEHNHSLRDFFDSDFGLSTKDTQDFAVALYESK